MTATPAGKGVGAHRRLVRRAKAIAALAAAGLALLLLLDRVYPLPQPGPQAFAVMVVADDGTPLRGFPDEQGVWRYPVGLADVSPLYIQALTQYEDRHFRSHPGVNPLALLRAGLLYLQHGRVISGGSTPTMQVARILDPHGRSLAGKCCQMLRALQLEWHYSKDEILTLYLNYAPFGGTIEGVQAASYAYLGKPAAELSHAEAALLAVLPQAPSRLRPDRHPDRAARARNKVLDRMEEFGVWDTRIVAEAKIEEVGARPMSRPMVAPLLARRLRDTASPDKPVLTTIDLWLQEALEDTVRRHVGALPPRTSAAVLVVANADLSAKAYVGSADFLDQARFGHVDMVRAQRSPGSTLKPFLYGFALEEGLVHSESLLVDAPFSFHGYRPGNFNDGFSGPVSVREALARSLNVPAVDVLDRMSPAFFDARLRQGGLSLTIPGDGQPNLALILGAAATSLEDLVGAYTSLARGGLSGRVRYLKDDPTLERRMLDPGAAYIIRRILQDNTRTDLPSGRVDLARSREVAWKTGTSYGFRDAWAIGVTDDYTVGVWVGRPDGTPSPGQYGRATAAPLLFTVIDSLPRREGLSPPAPSNVERVEICWPLGTRPEGPNDPLCHQRRSAWILNGAVPPTLPDRSDDHWLGNPLTVMVNPQTGLRVDVDCKAESAPRRIARWPQAVQPWLAPRLRQMSAIPPMDPICGTPVSRVPQAVRIMSLQPGTVLRPQGADTRLPVITLEAMGGRGRLFWFLNGELIGEAGIGQTRRYQFQTAGHFALVVMDQAGNYDQVEITVLAGQARS